MHAHGAVSFLHVCRKRPLARSAGHSCGLLACAGALHFWHFAKSKLCLNKRIARAAARFVDEAGSKPFLVIQQNFQKMFGRELLMAFT
jgi:hypothetical protein